jgi:hypothetical protein
MNDEDDESIGICLQLVDGDACNDGHSCTDDFCDLQRGMCVNEPNDNNCDDGSACTIDFCNRQVS